MKRWREKLRKWSLAALAAVALPLCAQDAAGLAWRSHAEPVAGNPGEVELVFSAPIHPGWIVYGSDFEAGDFGPRPAKVVLEDGGQALQPVRSVGTHVRSGRNFAGEYCYTYFAGEATLRQRVRLAPGAKRVSGVLNGQSCYEESGLCTLFREPFALALE